jgi:hypothetical protein
VLEQDYWRFSGIIMTENWFFDMGTSAIVQLNIENYSKIETAKEPKNQHCRNGSADRYWGIYSQRY